MSESNVPLISKTSFDCPHCGSFTSQQWYELRAESYDDEDARVPFVPTKEEELFHSSRNDITEISKRELLEWVKLMLKEKPFLEPKDSTLYNFPSVQNCFISKCFNCKEMSVWVHDKIVYPNIRINVRPNTDLSAVIQKLFNEARDIVDISPRGSAAILRLCVQHLCKDLGESGKNIDKDISSLVSKGLNPMVQKSLDIVRVIGNEAVHPGEIDLDDNREVSIHLFGLINLICDQMITHPKQVNEMYNGLPGGKLEGIEKRNIRATTSRGAGDAKK